MSYRTTFIDRPGLYLTRGGKQVRIDVVDRTTSSWQCSGHILRVDTLGRTYSKWTTWQSNGVHRAIPGSKLDIVAYVGA